METTNIYIPGHGTFQFTAEEMDRAIAKFLPTSVAALRAVCNERTGIDYSDVITVTELMAILIDAGEFQ